MKTLYLFFLGIFYRVFTIRNFEFDYVSLSLIMFWKPSVIGLCYGGYLYVILAIFGNSLYILLPLGQLLLWYKFTISVKTKETIYYSDTDFKKSWKEKCDTSETVLKKKTKKTLKYLSKNINMKYKEWHCGWFTHIWYLCNLLVLILWMFWIKLCTNCK